MVLQTILKQLQRSPTQCQMEKKNKWSATRRLYPHGEDPFECIECGRPFGVKSTIERIIEKLEGNHWMYTNSDNTKLVKMCDDCRINAQYHDENAPLRGPDRPRVRTTDDYLDS